MKIATYNIWNSDVNYVERINLLIQILREEKIDILVLQEVRDSNVVEYIKRECQFIEYRWKEYPDFAEGLAILSAYPIIRYWTNWDTGDEDIHNSGIMNVVLNVDGTKISITNVHLDYKRSYYREIEIVKAVRRIEEESDAAYFFMLGDFNTYPNSVIHGYLSGVQSIVQHSTSWIDLAESYSIKFGTAPEVTLDFNTNPRWDNEYSLEIPGRFDWIMLKNPYPEKSPKLLEMKLIGKQRLNGITPSDHYGLLCDIEV